jgi:hypothetical protein
MGSRYMGETWRLKRWFDQIGRFARYARLASDPLRATNDAVGAKIAAALRIGSTSELSVEASKAS